MRWASSAKVFLDPRSPAPAGDLAVYQDRARQVLGALENEVRLGNVWSGKRYVELGQGVVVEATVLNNFGDQPIVQARLFVPEDLQREEGFPIRFGGFGFDPAAGETVCISPQQDRSLRAYERTEGSSSFSFNLPVTLYGSLYPDELKFGSIDWQRGNVSSGAGLTEDYILSWSTNTRCRYQSPRSDGNRIYMRGLVHTRLPLEYGTLAGCAITENNEYVIAIGYNFGTRILTAARQPFSEIATGTFGAWEVLHTETIQFVQFQIGNNFFIMRLESCAAFSSSGSKAVMLFGVNEAAGQQLPGPYAVAKYDISSGFNVSYEQSGTYSESGNVLSGQIEGNEGPSAPRNQDSTTQGSGLLTGSITVISELSFGSTGVGFPISQKVPVALDYIGEELQELCYLHTTPHTYRGETIATPESGDFTVVLDYEEDPIPSTTIASVDSSATISINSTWPPLDYSYPLALNGQTIGLQSISGGPAAGTFTWSASESWSITSVLSIPNITFPNTVISNWLITEVEVIYADLRTSTVVYSERTETITDKYAINGNITANDISGSETNVIRSTNFNGLQHTAFSNSSSGVNEIEYGPQGNSMVILIADIPNNVTRLIMRDPDGANSFGYGQLSNCMPGTGSQVTAPPGPTAGVNTTALNNVLTPFSKVYKTSFGGDFLLTGYAAGNNPFAPSSDSFDLEGRGLNIFGSATYDDIIETNTGVI